MVIGAPLSDLITIEAGNIWGNLFLSRRHLYRIIVCPLVERSVLFLELINMISQFPHISKEVKNTLNASGSADMECLCVSLSLYTMCEINF